MRFLNLAFNNFTRDLPDNSTYWNNWKSIRIIEINDN